MNRPEAIRVYALLAAAWPAWKATDATLEIWVVALADLDFQAATVAVRDLIATTDDWPTVAALRRAVARRQGLLAPDIDVAWGEVADQMRRVGHVGRPKFSHPAIGAAVDGIGWKAMCASTSPDVVRGQFARLYQSSAARHGREATVPGGPVGALGGGGIVPELGGG